MADNLHEDFGEKIGGARKDLWKDRGLYGEDLDAMNEREAEKFVKKDNIWKKPDYQAMLDDGIPLGVVYFIKKARDSLNASPQYYRRDDTPEKRLARQKEYIGTVRQLQEAVEDVRSVEDAMQVCDRFMVGNGYLEQSRDGAAGAITARRRRGGRTRPSPTSCSIPSGSAPSPALTVISRRRRKRTSSWCRRSRRCRRAIPSAITTGRIPGPKTMTGNRAPGMSRRAIPSYRPILNRRRRP